MHRMRPFWSTLFLDGQGDPSGNGTQNPPAPNPPRDERRHNEPPSPGRVNSVVAELVARHGTPERALGRLVEENFNYRERHRQDKKKIETLANGVGPNDVVLKGKDVTEYNEFKTLKLTPRQIADLAKERDELKTKETARVEAERHTEAAKVYGWNPKVLTTLLSQHKLELEMKDITVEKDGQKTVKKVPHVRPAGKTDAAFEQLDTYFTKDDLLKQFIPALKTKSGNEENDTEVTEAVEWPDQSHVQSTAPDNAVKDATKKYLGSKYPKPSQLTQKQGA